MPAMFAGLLYAFNGYLVAYGTWYIVEFSATSSYYAFLLFSLQQSVKFNRWYLYPIAVCLLGILQPVNLYFTAIITVIYLVKRAFFSNTMSLKSFSYDVGIYFLLGALGIGLASFMLWSNVYQNVIKRQG